MHKIDGLIMAGGRSLRIKKLGEKPMIPLLNRPLIDYVLKAMAEASLIEKIYVTVSKHTTDTKEYLEKKTKDYHFQVIQTPGIDYIEDLRYAVKKFKLSEVLVCPVDTPLLRGELLDLLVKEFFRIGKPSLVSVVPLKLILSLGLEPTIIMRIDDSEMVPSGVNVIKGDEMITGAILEEDYFKINLKEFAVNINTKKDLEIAEKILKNFP
ncbi:MAG: NTP transferase domain-containing protein [Candidatus Lokiarchaeia archaeon]